MGKPGIWVLNFSIKAMSAAKAIFTSVINVKDVPDMKIK